MPWYKWSRTANTNANADSTINWAEGQSPSSINDSARAMMAATAMHRDDVAGAIVTAGTSTAYTVSSLSVFDSLADMNGMEIWFTPHTTNGATVTINVDSLGAKPLRSAPNAELLAGVLIQGTPYGATYNNSDGAWYLKGFFGNPFNIPLAGGLDYWGSSAPNSAFAFPTGQAINRTTYAPLYALIGNTYGAGDGSTTFNLPDKRERVSVPLGGAIRISNSYMTQTLGGAGGGQDTTLAATNIPSLTSTGSNTISVGPASRNLAGTTGTISTAPVPTSGSPLAPTAGEWEAISSPLTGTNNITVTTTGTNATAFVNLQPSIFCNYIMRII